jgi:hypothetical protein
MIDFVLIYFLAAVFGMAGSVHFGQANLGTSSRLIAGGVGGSAGAGLFANGPGYAILISCFNGSFDIVGYMFAFSFSALVLVWGYNLAREGRAIL